MLNYLIWLVLEWGGVHQEVILVLNSAVFALKPSTFIHNWPLQPFSQAYNLVSHTTYVACVNFIHEWPDLQFKFVSERQIFEEIFMAMLFIFRVFSRNLLRGSLRRNIFFIFRFDVWSGLWTMTLSLISQHTTWLWGHFIFYFQQNLVLKTTFNIFKSPWSSR